MAEEKFTLGVVVVTVCTVDGTEHVEDWNPKEAAEAKEYAAHTSDCGDVVWTKFEDHRSGEIQKFTKAA